MNGLYGGTKKPIIRRIMSHTESAPVGQPSPAAVKAISALVGILSLGVLVQAVTGGIFAREPNHKGLVDAHSGIAYLVAVLALAVAVVGFVMWRGRTAARWSWPRGWRYSYWSSSRSALGRRLVT